MNLIGNYLLYVGIGTGLLLLGMLLFAFTTKIKEFREIGEGNTTVSLMLGGKVLGLAIVLHAAISNSLNVVDMIIWGAIGIVTQIVAYFLVEICTPSFSVSKAVKENKISVGVLLLILSVSIGLLIAGSLTY